MSVVHPEHAPAHPAPALRLLPTPASEPPYDDELPPGRQRLRVEPLRLPSAPLRLVPPLGGAAHADDAPWSRSRTPLDALAPAGQYARAFVQRLVEVLAGVRPVTQLRHDTTPEMYARLERVVASRPRAVGPRPDSRAVRSVHVQTRPEGVAEVCATVKRQTSSGPRAAAYALRLEGLDGRWCCTELLGL